MKHINKSEVLRILELHSNYKKLLSEQKTDIKTQLQALVDRGCPKGTVVAMSDSNPNYQFAIKQTNSSKDVRYLHIDKTIKVLDTKTNKYVLSSQKWSCDNYEKTQEIGKKQNLQKWQTAKETGASQEELSNPAMYETTFQNGTKLYLSKARSNGVFGGNTEQQLQLIASWKGTDSNGNQLPWKTQNELNQGEYEASYPVIASPASEGLFPRDLIMYIQRSVLDENPEITPQSCSTNIKSFFERWQTNAQIPNGEFAYQKLLVEKCVLKFKIGGVAGKRIGGPLSKVDDYVKILQGLKTGGRMNTSPSAQSRYKLNNKIYRFVSSPK